MYGWCACFKQPTEQALATTTGFQFVSIFPRVQNPKVSKDLRSNVSCGYSALFLLRWLIPLHKTAYFFGNRIFNKADNGGKLKGLRTEMVEQHCLTINVLVNQLEKGSSYSRCILLV